MDKLLNYDSQRVRNARVANSTHSSDHYTTQPVIIASSTKGI